MFQKLRARIVLIFLLLAVSMSSHSSFHIVQISEVYSNASGTVQFVELTMLAGGQTFFSGQTIFSTQGGSTKSFTFPNNLSRGVAGAKVLIGTATITYANNSTATLAYTINGISATKSIQRQIFSVETTGPNLRINDLWWATAAEDGWGMNIAQQGRVLFPVWYTYDAAGKATFFTAQGGSWSGTVWSGTVYAHTSAAWLGVPYNGSQFTANIVGTISLDFSDASNAMMTYTVNGFTQVKRIERQPY